MIGLATIIFDLNGYLEIKENPDSEYPDLVRRVSRTASLDGSSVILDNGYTSSDGTYIVLVSNLSLSDRAILENIIKNHSLIILSSTQGSFSGVIESVQLRSDPITITFLIKEKVS